MFLYMVRISMPVLYCFSLKHKTAFDMRIIDWSPDVCSSDLRTRVHRRPSPRPRRRCDALSQGHRNPDVGRGYAPDARDAADTGACCCARAVGGVAPT